MTRTLGLLLFLLLSATAWAAPAQVLIIRHAEKLLSGPDLSSAGYARAQALVHYFESSPAVTAYGTPIAIYATGYDSTANNPSHRPVETITPLAKALGLPIQDQYLKKDIQSLVQEILNNRAYDGHMVLICWEHKMIPTIAEEFGVTDAPDKWKKSDFWDVWELNFSGDQVSSFQIFSQDLMPGDPSH